MEWTAKPRARRRGRHAFTPSEDTQLRKVVNDVGDNNWSKVAELMPGRNARQCRDRWRGYLRPTLVNSEWTEEEDNTLIQKYEEHGPRWSVIGRYIPGRAEIAIKNRWKLLSGLSRGVVMATPPPFPYYPMQFLPIAPHQPVPPMPATKMDTTTKKTADSSPETSAGESESITTAKELEAFFSTLSLPKLRHGTKRF